MSDSEQQTSEQATPETVTATTGQPEPGAVAETPVAAEAESEAESEAEAKSDDQAPAIDYSELKLPDGLEANDQLEKLKELAAPHGVPVEFLGDALTLYKEGLDAAAEANIAAWNAEADNWRAAVNNDPEIGGRNIDATMSAVAKAIDKFGSPELRAVMDSTRMGDHPEVVKLLARVGKELAEDVPLDAGAASQPNPLQALYPTMFKGS